MNDSPKSTIALIEQLRRVDELVFLHWETFEEDLMCRILRSSIGMIDIVTESTGLVRGSHDGEANRAGPVNLSAFREYKASEYRARRNTSQEDSGVPGSVPSSCNCRLPVSPSIRGIAANIPDEEIVLSVVKQEARRRAQRDLYILMLYYPGEHVMSAGQIEGMFEAAGIDTRLPTSQLILKALDLYRESGAAPIGYSDWPQVIVDQPALARVPGLTENERIHLFALEASLAVVERVRTAELAEAGIHPEDPLLDRLQRLEEEAVALFIAQNLEENDTSCDPPANQDRCPTAGESERSCSGIANEGEEIDPELMDFPESVSRALFSAAADFAMSAENPIETLEENYDLLGAVQSGISPNEATRIRLLGFLYKALILEAHRFLDVEDEELRSAIGMLNGKVEDLFPCKLRLLLTELRELQTHQESTK